MRPLSSVQRLTQERPQLTKARTSYTYYQDTQTVPWYASVHPLNRPHSITADVEIPAGGADCKRDSRPARVIDGSPPWKMSRSCWAIAVVLSAWRAGHTAGLFATVLSVAAGTGWFVAPYVHDQSLGAAVQTVLFVLVALCLVWVTERIHRGQREVRIREERFRSLVDATTSIVWTSNAGGAFVERQGSWEACT